MTQKELLKYCRYYKGEAECPYKKSTEEETFWGIEQQYVMFACEDDEWREYEEDKAKRYERKVPKENNIFSGKDLDIHTKGIGMYILEMLDKWMPDDTSIAFNY